MADVTFASGLTFGGSVTNDVIGTFSEPTTQTPNLDVGYFGPNFQFTAAVAEPSTWATMLLGFAGLGFAARRRWERRFAPRPESQARPHHAASVRMSDSQASVARAGP